MKERLLITIGVMLVVGGAFGGYLVYQEADTGSNFLTVTDGLVVEDLQEEVAQSKGQNVPVIVAYEPVTSSMSVKSLTVRAQNLKSMAVRNLSVYGFTLSQEKAIPAFGMVVGEAPAENIGKIARSPNVRAVVKNRFISLSQFSSGSYADMGEVESFHEVDNLPRADNTVVCVVDSSAPDEEWVENAVSVRGDKPYAGYWHGDVVSKVIHEVSPNSTITVVKVMDEYGTGRLSTILKGLQTTITMKPRADIINLSLGTPSRLYNPIDLACNTLEREYGVEIIAASGNTGGGPETSPATAESTLSVGALDGDKEVAEYSSSEYDVLAIGSVIVNGDSVKGTSFSAPVVSGMVSRWLSVQKVRKDIALKNSVMSSVSIMQGADRELPVVKGSGLSQTKAETEESPESKTMPYVVVSGVGLLLVGIGIEASEDYP